MRMVLGMIDSHQRPSLASRLAANISRQDEDVRDWVNGPGQRWLAAVLFVMVLGFVYFGVRG